jgi:hypothetical protein
MSRSCQACGTALLDSDTTCYRCGAPTSGREPNDQSPAEEKASLGAAAVFAGVVLGLLILGAVLANWMGAGYTNPLEETPTPPAPAGWYECLSPQGDYRIRFPNSWHCYTSASPEWEELTGHLAHPLPDSFQRHAPGDRRERLSMIAQSWAADGSRALTLSIELHPALGETPLEILRQESWWVGDRWVDTTGGLSIQRRDSGERMLIADLIYPSGAGDYVQSITAILKTGRGAYAVAVSGIDEEFWQTEELLWEILDSFRPLDSN